MVDVTRADPLSPDELARILSTLTIAQALVVELVLGRPAGQGHVRAVRRAIADLNAVLEALDVGARGGQ